MAVANVGNKIVQVKVDMNIYMEMVLIFGKNPVRNSKLTWTKSSLSSDIFVFNVNVNCGAIVPPSVFFMEPLVYFQLAAGLHPLYLAE